MEAFAPLIDRYARTLLAAALAKLHNVHSAEDVVQETLLLAFRRLETLRDGEKFGAWLMQIARRKVVDSVRSRKPVHSLNQAAENDHVDGAELHRWIEYEYLFAALDHLTEDERSLVGLRYFDGHSMSEIAAILGRPVGTVTKQLSRTMSRLRTHYDEELLL